LGCPVGSLLCGTRDFIAQAHRVRKLIGGGMRQSGIIAAAGIIALETMVERLAEDHLNASAWPKGWHWLRASRCTRYRAEPT
jgi:threonine aldolase